ncbi:MAG: lecithin retinol acyltransferase family protein [Phormidesmis sp.]
MARGDQVYAIREIVGVPYEHHGIDCGDGTLIHYRKTGEAQIARTSSESFARGGAIYTKPVSTAFIPDVVINRAESRLGEQRYDLFFNNCEHFADWCKTGRGECSQLDDFGLRFGHIKLPEVGELAQRAAQQAGQTESPERTSLLFREALSNVAIATNTLLPQYKQAAKDTLTWHRVAQLALTKSREDLARAALYRKVAAQKEADRIKAQLSQLSDLQLTLEQNQKTVQGRMA